MRRNNKTKYLKLHRIIYQLSADIPFDPVRTPPLYSCVLVPSWDCSRTCHFWSYSCNTGERSRRRGRGGGKPTHNLKVNFILNSKLISYIKHFPRLWRFDICSIQRISETKSMPMVFVIDCKCMKIFSQLGLNKYWSVFDRID